MANATHRRKEGQADWPDGLQVLREVMNFLNWDFNFDKAENVEEIKCSKQTLNQEPVGSARLERLYKRFQRTFRFRWKSFGDSTTFNAAHV